MSGTGCTATRFGRHDYSQPPHALPDAPVPSETGPGLCNAQTSSVGHEPLGLRCDQHKVRYRVVLFQIGTHEWIEMFCCAPCTAILRHRHAQSGPGRTSGVHSVSDVRAAA